jgi:hypothetical protein
MPRISRGQTASVISCLETISTALDDIADANTKLVGQHQRIQALFARFQRVARARAGAAAGKPREPAREAAEMLKIQIAMQRENALFTSISNIVKARHDTAKNSIGNLR